MDAIFARFEAQDREQCLFTTLILSRSPVFVTRFFGGGELLFWSGGGANTFPSGSGIGTNSVRAVGVWLSGFERKGGVFGAKVTGIVASM